ncbi:MAG TPA: type II toxin-antitoxin system prevent-host-death family antitoxin [Candidatus Binataceae bacterium]|nr:type II toxin-antitoxin system prevent-host-death family antitoxin [Candidatus Binataceae bacterium]
MRIGLREANQQFSRIMKAVRNGAEVVLTDRGRPVAKLTPIDKLSGPAAGAIRRLEAQGLVRRPLKAGPLPRWKPRKIAGAPISQTLSEERDER